MLLDKVRETIAKYNMLQNGDRVLAGVSGGPDSIALIYVLNSLKREFNLSLFTAHLNHMIRKTAAEEDALFVKKISKRINCPSIIESKDVPRLAKASRLSIEEAARNARYDFYLRAAEGVKADKIALGHTEDDQAETLLMRLIRGSGLLGLSAMPPVRGFADKKIIRPLIDVSKDEIEKFLKAKKIPFRVDKTNLQPIYLRNRIRQQLIPILEKGFNPEIKKILKETARNIRIDYDFISKIGERKFRKYATMGGQTVEYDSVSVPIKKLLDEDVAVQRLIFREAIRAIKGNLEAVTYRHWEDLNQLLKKSGRSGRWRFVLPGGILIKKADKQLVFYKQDYKQELGVDKGKKGVYYELAAPGEIKIPKIKKTIRADFVKRPLSWRRKKSKKTEYFDFENLRLPLSVRFREGGERIVPLGMAGRKRIKDIFIDEKVPAEKRALTPLVCSGDKIIWVCGVKRSNVARITDTTRKTLRLKIE